MIVYRIGRTRYAYDLKGEGARLFGGRWNHKLTACIYTSQSRALSLLEYSVNINLDDIPRALSITSIFIPDEEIKTIGIDMLPGNWKDSPAPASTKDFGTRLIMEARYAVLKIPSAIIPEEYNYMLNPVQANSKYFKIEEVREFSYDVRIKG